MEEESQLRRSTKLSRSRNRQVLKSSRRRPGMGEEERGSETSGSVQEDSPLPPKKPDLKEGSDNPGQAGLLKPDEEDDIQPYIRRSSATVGKMQRPRVATRPKVMTRPQTRSRQSGEDEKENKPENVAPVEKSAVSPPKETEKLKDDKTDTTPSITVAPEDEDLQPFMRRTSATVDKNARPRVMTRPKVVPRPQVRSRRSRDVPAGEEQVEQHSHDPPPPIDVTSDVHMQERDEANTSTLGSQDNILPVSTPAVPRVDRVQIPLEEDSNLSTSVVKSDEVDIVKESTHPAIIDQSVTNFQHNLSDSNTPMEVSTNETQSLMPNEDTLESQGLHINFEDMDDTNTRTEPMTEVGNRREDLGPDPQLVPHVSKDTPAMLAPTEVNSSLVNSSTELLNTTTVPTVENEPESSSTMGTKGLSGFEETQTTRANNTQGAFKPLQVSHSVDSNQEGYSSEAIHEPVQNKDVLEDNPNSTSGGVTREIPEGTGEQGNVGESMTTGGDLEESGNVSNKSPHLTHQPKALVSEPRDQDIKKENPDLLQEGVFHDSTTSDTVTAGQMSVDLEKGGTWNERNEDGGRYDPESLKVGGNHHIDRVTFNVETQQEVPSAVEKVEMQDETMQEVPSASQEVTSSSGPRVGQEMTPTGSTPGRREMRRMSPSGYRHRQRRIQSSTSEQEENLEPPGDTMPQERLNPVKEGGKVEAASKLPPNTRQMPTLSSNGEKLQSPPLHSSEPTMSAEVFSMDTTSPPEEPVTLKESVTTEHEKDTSTGTSQPTSIEAEAERKSRESSPELGIRRGSRTVSAADKGKLPQGRRKFRVEGTHSLSVSRRKEDSSLTNTVLSKSPKSPVETQNPPNIVLESASSDVSHSEETPGGDLLNTTPANSSLNPSLRRGREKSPLPGADDLVDISSFNLSSSGERTTPFKDSQDLPSPSHRRNVSRSKYVRRDRSPSPVKVPVPVTMVTVTGLEGSKSVEKPHEQKMVDDDGPSRQGDDSDEEQIGIRRGSRLSGGEREYLQTRKLRKMTNDSEKGSISSIKMEVESNSSVGTDKHQNMLEGHRSTDRPQPVMLQKPDITIETDENGKTETKSLSLSQGGESPQLTSGREAETGQKKLSDSNQGDTTLSSQSDQSPGYAGRRRTAVLRRKTGSKSTSSGVKRTRRIKLSSSEEEESSSASDDTKMKDPFRTVQFVHEPNVQLDANYKILLLGSSGVGKTCFLLRLCNCTYSNNYTATLGVDLKNVTYNHNKKMLGMKMWDTAGQERFQSITRNYYSGAHLIMIFFDVTYQQSFQDVKQWISSVRDALGQPPPILLLGNKIDLTSKRVIDDEVAQSIADVFKATYVEVSAKTGENVADAFEKMVGLITEAEVSGFYKEQIRTPQGAVNVSKAKKVVTGTSNTSSGCCGS